MKRKLNKKKTLCIEVKDLNKQELPFPGLRSQLRARMICEKTIKSITLHCLHCHWWIVKQITFWSDAPRGPTGPLGSWEGWKSKVKIWVFFIDKSNSKNILFYSTFRFDAAPRCYGPVKVLKNGPDSRFAK